MEVDTSRRRTETYFGRTCANPKDEKREIDGGWTIVLKYYVPRKERDQGGHIRVCPRGLRFWPAGTQKKAAT